MLVIPTLRRLRLEYLRFEASLEYIAASPRLVCTGLTVRPCLKKRGQKKRNGIIGIISWLWEFSLPTEHIPYYMSPSSYFGKTLGLCREVWLEFSTLRFIWKVSWRNLLSSRLTPALGNFHMPAHTTWVALLGCPFRKQPCALFSLPREESACISLSSCWYLCVCVLTYAHTFI